MPNSAPPHPSRRPASASVGVVAMTMGGPVEPEEVRPFLRALFADPELIQVPVGPFRSVFARMVSLLRAPAARKRYAAIGGSPLVAESLAQCSALESALAEAGKTWPVRLAVAYGPRGPSSHAALDALAALGVRHVLALPLYPQRSRTTTGASMRALRAAADRHHPGMSIREVPPYPTLPGLVEYLCEATVSALSALDQARQLPAAVLATAHSLPERYVARGDAYVDQVWQTHAAFTQAIASRRPDPAPTAVALGFQSRVGPVKWVGPPIAHEVARLARQGARSLVVVPLTFVSEHLETRYDLDLKLRRVALACGLRAYRRVAAPCTAPPFITSLAAHVEASCTQGNS